MRFRCAPGVGSPSKSEPVSCTYSSACKPGKFGSCPSVSQTICSNCRRLPSCRTSQVEIVVLPIPPIPQKPMTSEKSEAFWAPLLPHIKPQNPSQAPPPRPPPSAPPSHRMQLSVRPPIAFAAPSAASTACSATTGRHRSPSRRFVRVFWPHSTRKCTRAHRAMHPLSPVAVQYDYISPVAAALLPDALGHAVVDV